ncbi:hypothetical protein BDQ17DRAFT_1428109 [Cyathus striatus]|nr:hypothetical protein BDQ17DRAFT_1428109 [Cyathus striatus]
MSVVWLILDPTSEFGCHKSHDRLICVQSFESSTGGQSNTTASSMLHEGLASNQLPRLGSLFATLLSTDRKGVSLAVLQCTSIKSSSQLVDSAPVDEVCLKNSSYNITGQILELIPLIYPHDSDVSHTHPTFWLWTSLFVALDKPTKTQRSNTSTNLANLNFSVNGRLVYPFNNGELKTVEVESLLQPLFTSGYSEFEVNKLENLERTWCIDDIELGKAQDELIRHVQQDDSQTCAIITVTGLVQDGIYPYSPRYYTTVVKPLENGHHPCNICEAPVKPKERQHHIGKHIIHTVLGVPANPAYTGTVSTEYPCGFCGQSTQNGGCTIHIMSNKAISTCKYAYPFLVSATAQISRANPCTNNDIPAGKKS